ncbi:MAG: RNA polymerase sigma factor [Bacteroidales bacterium]
MKSDSPNSGLNQFIASEYKNLVRYVKQLINERYYNVSAEDVVQDVALNLFSKLDIDAKVENVGGYVYRSIRNKIVDIRRKKKNEMLLEKFNDDSEESSDDLMAKLQQKGSELNFEIIDDEQFYQKFDEAFKMLPSKHRAIIIATEFEGHSFEEISDEWKIPIGTLLSWKHRGIKKLKEYIKLDDFYTVHDEN